MIYKSIDLSQLDPQIDTQIAKDYIDHRKTIKKPLTQRAFNAQMKNALRAFELEKYGISMTPNEVIEWTLDNTNWQKIDPIWVANQLVKNKATEEVLAQQSMRISNQSTRNIPLQQQLNDRAWAHH